MRLLGKYINGNIVTSIYNDGTKVRKTNDNYFVPLCVICVTLFVMKILC